MVSYEEPPRMLPLATSQGYWGPTLTRMLTDWSNNMHTLTISNIKIEHARVEDPGYAY